MSRFLVALLALVIISCNNENDTDPDPAIAPPPQPATINYSLIKTYPHDTSSYTQGLVVYNGQLYEGTGNYGFSHLMKTDLETGKALVKLPLDRKYFGEGITILRDTLYQLTWKENTVFAYALPGMKKVREFSLPTDGWGLTNNGKELIVSDGSSNLYYYDPSTFSLLKKQTVMIAGSLAYNINELEYIDGYIYANQYGESVIFKIDPATGIVVGKADLSPLREKALAGNPKLDVLNGIAYDSATKKVYVTGKWWPELYEISFSQ